MDDAARLASLEQQLQHVQNEIASVRENIKKKKKQPKRKIDLSRLPIDTPVLVRDCDKDPTAPMHFSGVSPLGEAQVFGYGGTSYSTHVVMVSSFNHLRIDFDACKPQPWFGGQQPVPDGIIVRVWTRMNGVSQCEASRYKWEHDPDVFIGGKGDIVNYQMIGIAPGWEV